ncbi:hypothetical protein DRP04_06925 [Archaeoglobales archaeon]|nr:MAG: hypothetical protein DRP04_06925 [Archaeoglobales archaeon]
MDTLKNITVEDLLGGKDVFDDSEAKGIHGTKSWVLTILRQNPDGVTAKMVAEIVGISERRAREILEELVTKREAYSRKVQNIKLYYPNGKLIHKYLQESREFGNQIFRLSFHEGKRGPILQIQERKFSLLEGEKVEGSIFVELENIEGLVNFIREMYERFRMFKEEEVS